MAVLVEAASIDGCVDPQERVLLGRDAGMSPPSTSRVLSLSGMGDRRGLFLTETMGSIAWFAMDGCWLMGSSALAGVLGVPTVLLNLLSLRFVPREWASWLSTGAMSAWACMNVLWLFGDSRLLGFSGLFAARLFFAAGALLLLASIALGRRESFDPLVARFRRLRLRQADPRRS